MFEFSRGRCRNDNQPVQRSSATFEDFCNALLADRGAKKGQQYICAPMAIAADDDIHRSQKTFEKAIGKAHRCKACALPRRWIGLDIDGGLDEVTFEKFKAAIGSYNCIIYTTSSHKVGDFHLRVVVEADRMLHRADLQLASRQFRTMVDELLPGISVRWDSSCDKSEQPLYLPLKNAHHLRINGRPFVWNPRMSAPPVLVPPEAAKPLIVTLVDPDAEAITVLKRQSEKISRTEVGSRNNALNSAAYLLGGYIGAGRLVRGAVEEALLSVTSQWPEPEKTKATLLSGIESGMRSPLFRELPESPGPGSADLLESESPCSDLANAHRIVRNFGKKLLYVEGVGWHISGRPWRLDELAAKKLVYGLSGIVADEAQAMEASCSSVASQAQHAELLAAIESRRRWAKKSEQLSVVESAMKMAEPLLSCRACDMDANPLLVGTPSGVLDLLTCSVRPYTELDRISKTIACDYDPAAACPGFTKFIHEIMGQDTELIDYLQRILGYAISGQRHEQMLPILFGTGANGKSTLVNAVQEVLGEYASTAAPGLLIAKIGNSNSLGEADLMGRRLVVVSETGESERLNEEQVKRLTSREPIKARRLYQQLMQFIPSHLLLLQTNHKPRVAGTDHGIWRRIKLIPFVVTIEESLRDANLSEKIRQEFPGLLAWMVQGWKKYQCSGLPTPGAVAAATAEYRTASDKVGMFLSEKCLVGPHLQCSTDQLYRAYERWCVEENERPVSKNRLTQQLLERGGFVQTRTKSVRGWQGVAVDMSTLLGLPPVFPVHTVPKLELPRLD